MKKLCMAVLLYTSVILPSGNNISCEFPKEIIIHPSIFQNIDSLSQLDCVSKGGLDKRGKVTLLCRHESKNDNDTSVQVHIKVNKETKVVESELSMPYQSNNPGEVIEWHQQAIATLVKALIPSIKERWNIALSEFRKDLIDSECVNELEEQVSKCLANRDEIRKKEEEVSACQNDDA